MEEIREIDKLKAKREKNLKLYIKYKMFSWDMLFYYAIIFLFFTQVKNISASNVLLAEAFYPLFKAVLLLILTVIIEKLGKRKALIIGNIFIALSTLTYIFAVDFYMILLGQFFSAVGFVIKGICETNLLYDSLEKDSKRGARFSKIDGEGSSLYYYIDAITSVLSGFMFAINGYLPMIFCLIINIVSIVMSVKFEEVDTLNEKKKVKIGTELNELKNSMSSIFKSKRIKNLILFGAIFSGILGALVSLRSSILSDIKLPAQYFGIIFAVLQIISGISAKNQYRFHKKFRNKTLASLSLPVVISCIFIGLICSLDLNYKVTICVTILAFLIQYIAKGPFYTLIKQYMNNFTTSSLRTKITSLYSLLEGISRSAICFMASFLLKYTNTANTFTILGCIFTVITVLMLDNMKDKVGLKPEEYSEKDIKILELK